MALRLEEELRSMADGRERDHEEWMARETNSGWVAPEPEPEPHQSLAGGIKGGGGALKGFFASLLAGGDSSSSSSGGEEDSP